ncbi:winged helix-turn-helix domain-containing protein [Actinoplanes sp. NPDC051513]|uniref:winged helix-turn-helix domain-containing protein n=1 Tax=Actinoplanes sp. NPDC051513 TaxID=3363908 RepID=UPI0037B9B239
MLPVLRSVADGNEHRIADLRTVVAGQLGLTEEDLALKIRSGAPVFNNRVHWAVTYLAQTGVLRRPRRGMVELTRERLRSSWATPLRRLMRR